MSKLYLRMICTLCVSLLVIQCKPQSKTPSTDSPSETPSTEAGSMKVENSNSQEELLIAIGVSFDQRQQALRNAQFEVLERLVQSRPKTQLFHASADFDEEKQSQQVEQMLQDGAKYLLVFPVNYHSLLPVLKKAKASGVEVVLLTQAPKDADSGFGYIFVDEFKLGRMIGEAVGAALKTKFSSEGPEATMGKVVQIRGDESEASVQRGLGFRAGVNAMVGQALVHDAPAFWNLSAVSARLEEAIRLHPKFDVIYAHDDLLAEAAHEWIRQSNHKLNRDQILIVGTDGYPGEGAGQNLVQRNRVDLSAYHPPLLDVAWEKILEHAGDQLPTLSRVWEVQGGMMTSETLESLQNQGLQKPVIQESQLLPQ